MRDLKPVAGTMALGAVSMALGTAAMASKPNIILIMTDQQTASAMSCTGNPWLNTPAMDALASEGVRFTSAYCSFPLSGPSRCSLLTGYMPARIGVKNNAVRPKDGYLEQALGHRLSDAGYECFYAGKWHAPEINVPSNAGFRKICDMADTIVASETAKALDSRDKSKPLFLVASFLDPHEICEFARDEALHYGSIPAFETSDCPNLPANFRPSTYEPEALRKEVAAAPRTYPSAGFTENEWRRYLYAYYRLIERADSFVGDLVKVLKDRGLYDNSVIIFMSDHGDGAAAHQWNQKSALFEECINVPLIVKAPGAEKGKVSDALCSSDVDVFATICDYAGVKLETRHDGTSLRPLAEGRQSKIHDEVFIETYLSGIDTRGWCVTDGKYKYVVYNWFRNNECLYDLENDKGEMMNLAVDKAYSGVISKMRKKLLSWAEDVGDPRLPAVMRSLISSEVEPSGHINGNR
jgi:arylsulfatase A-like enzyme